MKTAFGQTSRTRARLHSTGYSSDKYGPCEVCMKRASDVWIRSHSGKGVFGHEDCLRKPWSFVLHWALKNRRKMHGKR